MRKAHQITAGLLALMVVVQAAAIAYALFGLGKWIEDDGGVLNKQVLDSDEKLGFRGEGGFALHGIDGMMIIPLITIVMLVIALLANKQVPGAAKRGGILFLMVAIQVALGLGGHSVVVLGPLHAINGFGIFAMAAVTARKAGEAAPAAVATA